MVAVQGGNGEQAPLIGLGHRRFCSYALHQSSTDDTCLLAGLFDYTDIQINISRACNPGSWHMAISVHFQASVGVGTQPTEPPDGTPDLAGDRPELCRTCSNLSPAGVGLAQSRLLALSSSFTTVCRSTLLSSSTTMSLTVLRTTGAHSFHLVLVFSEH